MKKKTLAIVLAVVVLVSVITTGTIAWLTAKTPPITNTFAPSNIGLVLSESDNLNLKMIPGEPITKDPVVTVTKNSEACYVFVKIEKANGFDDFMTYTIADGWTELTAGSGIYYREVTASANDQPFDVLKGHEVQVKDSVTKDMMATLYDEDGNLIENLPKLTFTAYAIQSANLTDANGNAVNSAAGAWELVPKSNN